MHKDLAWGMLPDEANFEAAKKTKALGPSKIKNNKLFYKQFYASNFSPVTILLKFFANVDIAQLISKIFNILVKLN